MERGQLLPVFGRNPRNRDADRRLQELPAGRRPRATAPHRPGPARPGGRLSCPRRNFPPPGPKPFFSQLDAALSDELRRQIGLPFWIDTLGRSSILEVRIKLDDTIMRVFARRADAYDFNSWIFLVWMVATSLVVLTIAILFLRNQIRPIVRLADAAEAFGKGREVANFRPRGAREVRRAAAAFLEMKSRIERAIEQRTTMLAGVSHDLRTILTRFKLELAFLGDSAEVEAMNKDVDEMAGMLEAYLAFARGDMGEQPAPTDMAAMLEELKADSERHGHRDDRHISGSAGSHRAPGSVQALPCQSRLQRCAICIVCGDRRPSRSPLADGDRSTTTGRAFRRRCARMSSSRSCGSTMRATRTKAVQVSGLPSPAISRARMAATSRWAIRRSADCARLSASRSKTGSRRAAHLRCMSAAARARISTRCASASASPSRRLPMVSRK